METLTRFRNLVGFLFSEGYLVVFLLWATWICTATAFYAIYDDFGWSRGFYYAISIGFTIGWSTPLEERDEWSYVFSCAHICAGLLAISGMVTFITHVFSLYREKWYLKYLRCRQRLRAIVQARQRGEGGQGVLWQHLGLMYDENATAIHIWILLTLYSLMGVIATCYLFGWNPIDGFYYVICTMSTTGAFPLPDDLDERLYAVIGCYALMGVMISTIGIMLLGKSLMNRLLYKRLTRELQEPFTVEEFEALRHLKVYTGSGTRSEFIVLIALRLGLIDEDFIGQVHSKFDSLFDPTTGRANMDALLQQHKFQRQVPHQSPSHFRSFQHPRQQHHQSQPQQHHQQRQHSQHQQHQSQSQSQSQSQQDQQDETTRLLL